MANQPNFLFIITDQQRADHLGCYGNPIVKTPCIDGLAVNGLRFDRFYVASASCQPNRASILTGRMPSLHGVKNNGIPLPLDATTFVDVLRVHGYETALLGKGHFQNMTGNPPVQNFERKEGLDVPDEEVREARKGGWLGTQYELENEKAWPTPLMERWEHPYYGFKHFEVATSHGDEVAGDYLLWGRQKNSEFDQLRALAAAPKDPNFSAPQCRKTQIPEDLYASNFVAERTIAYLEKYVKEDAGRPFFIQMGFPDPHYPFTPPGKYWGMYDPADIPLPSSFEADGPPIAVGVKARTKAGKVNREAHQPFGVDKREAQEIIALTYGMITMIDDCVDQVLKTLERLNLAQNTIVVFMSDHGDHMGDYGIMLKSAIQNRGLIRTPFIWRDLDRRADTVGGLASAIDVGPTILRRAGIQPFNGMHGRDLLDPNAAPEGVVVEIDNPFGVGPTEKTRTFVTDRWRMTLHQGLPGGELIDLEADPDELHNLWDDPGHTQIRMELTEKFLRRIVTLQEASPLQTGLS